MKGAPRALVGVLAMLLASQVQASTLLTFLEEHADKPAHPGVVNINTATKAQLCLLPGIGPSRALAIIRFRTKRPFRRKEQLLRIRGIGAKSLIQLRPYVSLEGPTTLKEKVPRARPATR